MELNKDILYQNFFNNYKKCYSEKKKGKSVSEGSQREMGSLEKRIQRTEWIFKYCESRNWRSTEENNQKKSVFLQPFNEQGKTNF